MRNVYVAGVGMTRFGRLEGMELRSLGAEACREAILDSGIDRSRIESAFVGTAFPGHFTRQECAVGQLVLRQLGITGIPVMRVENACASGSSALREAWISVASGLVDVALAFGVEKLSNVPTSEVMSIFSYASDYEAEGSAGIIFPGVFAMIAQAYMHEYGVRPEQLAEVSVKNHRHGFENPRAQRKLLLTVEDVQKAKMVCDPLTSMHCCPISDGAAAVVLVSESVAREVGRGQIRLAAVGLATGDYDAERPLTTFPSTRRAAEQAYRLAGVGPEDIKVAEVHDCFSVAELVHLEDLGFCERGDAAKVTSQGETTIGGRLPVNTSGGLLSKGHPVGATGIAQVVELTEQLRGHSGPRQVEGANVGLAMCMGGFMFGDGCAATVTILHR